jgi:hypothetical protein
MTSKEDIEGINKPITFACVGKLKVDMLGRWQGTHSFLEGDPHFPDDFREESRKFLQEHKREHEMRVYQDVPHGKFRTICSHCAMTDLSKGFPFTEAILTTISSLHKRRHLNSSSSFLIGTDRGRGGLMMRWSLGRD